jgi:hypothetical protein
MNCKNRTKTTWNIVKSLTGRKPNQPLNALDNSYINPKRMADSFNKYFLSIAETITNNAFGNSNLSGNEYLIHVFKSTFPLINYSYASTNEIQMVIDKLKMTNSYGYDEIPVNILNL